MKKRTKAPVRSPAARGRSATTKVGALALPAECTIADAGELKTRLQKLLAHKSPVTVDRAAVQRIDTATLQMLAAFVRDRRAQGLVVEWSGEGATLRNAANLLGLAALL